MCARAHVCICNGGAPCLMPNFLFTYTPKLVLVYINIEQKFREKMVVSPFPFNVCVSECACVSMCTPIAIVTRLRRLLEVSSVVLRSRNKRRTISYFIRYLCYTVHESLWTHCSCTERLKVTSKVWREFHCATLGVPGEL